MGQILSVMSNIMYLTEKFTMCLAAGTVVTCLVFTLIMMLGLGVGLGYNYCFVEIKTKHRYVPGYYRYKVEEATRGRTPAWRRITTTFRRSANLMGKAISLQLTGQLNDTNNTAYNEAVDNSTKFSRIESTTETTTDKTAPVSTPKIILKIKDLDLIALITKLRSENINYTLQIVTT